MKKTSLFLILLILATAVSAQNATIKGVVLDSLDNLVSGAELKADCLEGENFTTDKFGSFRIESVPKGGCRVYATFGEGVGFEDVYVENETVDLEIKLDKTIVKLSERNNDWLVVLGMGILILIIILLYLKRLSKKEKKLEKKEIKEEKEIKELKQKRVQDILKTLDKKEREVVKFLLENNYKSSQAKIRHGTGITRTSLARRLKNLEAKNIVSVERLGKLVKVKLTNWFLEKE